MFSNIRHPFQTSDKAVFKNKLMKVVTLVPRVIVLSPTAKRSLTVHTFPVLPPVFPKYDFQIPVGVLSYIEKFDDLHSDTLRKRTEVSHCRETEHNKTTVKHFIQCFWTYNSNALDGSQLTLEDTMQYVALGEEPFGPAKEQFVAARNHDEAVKFLDKEVSRGAELTPQLIKELHFDLWRDTETTHGGSYRKDSQPMKLPDGNYRTLADPTEIPGQIQELCDWVNAAAAKDLHPIIVASIVHHNFTRIHPFFAGNGRCGRLVMNYVLTKAAYLPAVIRCRRKAEYIHSLECANNGDIGPLARFITDEMSYSDYIYLFFTTDLKVSAKFT